MTLEAVMLNVLNKPIMLSVIMLNAVAQMFFNHHLRLEYFHLGCIYQPSQNFTQLEHFSRNANALMLIRYIR